MAITGEERHELQRRAKELGIDPSLFVDAAEKSDQESAKEPPGKKDPAAPAATGQESAVKAHGGRGYFAYEYEVLRVNEIRASLFLEPAPDGEMFFPEWRRKFGGGSGAPADKGGE